MFKSKKNTWGSKHIRSSECKRIADQYGYDQIIVIGINKNERARKVNLGTCSYGKTEQLDRNAFYLSTMILKRKLVDYFNLEDQEIDLPE